jgi:hypothetical protein
MKITPESIWRGFSKEDRAAAAAGVVTSNTPNSKHVCQAPKCAMARTFALLSILSGTPNGTNFVSIL